MSTTPAAPEPPEPPDPERPRPRRCRHTAAEALVPEIPRAAQALRVRALLSGEYDRLRAYLRCPDCGRVGHRSRVRPYRLRWRAADAHTLERSAAWRTRIAEYALSGMRNGPPHLAPCSRCGRPNADPECLSGRCPDFEQLGRWPGMPPAEGADAADL